MTDAFTAILIGAGNRGADTYARWALAHPDRLRIIAVAEPDPARRQRVSAAHGIPAAMQFDDYRSLLSLPSLSRAAIIATQDHCHTEPALLAMKAGYDVLLEKPMATTPAECASLVAAAESSGRLLQVCHVMRYTEFAQALKQVLASGILGQVITISHRENVSSWHMAHSYVRGNWRSEQESSPMILAKCCHDLDLLVWLLDEKPLTVSSVGSLRHFQPENAPPGAPARCTDGCPVEDTCPFYAPSLYLDLNPITFGLSHARHPLTRFAGRTARSHPALLRAMSWVMPPLRQLTAYDGWPRSIITSEASSEKHLYQALDTGPYGRCVYHCDNDVVDHQVVLMAFPSGISATLTMHGHSEQECRTIRIDGSQASLFGRFGFNETFIEVRDHRDFSVKRWDFANEIESGGHGGGDEGLMEGFVDALAGVSAPLTDARTSLESHLLAFAAEEARLQGTVVAMPDYRSRW